MLKKLSYFAATVSNLERSVAFYRDQLGMRVQRTFALSGPGLEQVAALPGARAKVAEMQNFDGHLFRLIEYLSPKGKQTFETKFDDIGHTHRTVMMPNIIEQYERLKSRGVRFVAPPVEPMPDTFPELKFAYMMDPDGMIVELLQYSVFHSARTVSDRESAREFYIDKLGFFTWINREARGKAIEQGTQVPGAHLLITHAAVGNDSMELVYFVGSKGREKPLKVNDVGCCYPAYQVDDIRRYHADLKRSNVEFLSEPAHIKEDPEFLSMLAVDPDKYLIEFRQPV